MGVAQREEPYPWAGSAGKTGRRRPSATEEARPAWVAMAVAAFVFAFSLAATAARREDPVSNAYLERAYPEAEGRNVVNVVLVDFRGLDTLGEIAVLAVAAVGAIMLVRGRRREDLDRP